MARKFFVILWLISILVFSSSVWGENVSTLLEEGIYAEETKGDMDEAMTIYKKIIDENVGNSANIAEAYYRLGTCYLKTGDDAKAIDMFKKLLTGFREHEEIASDARDQLVKLNALDEEDQIVTPLELGPVPWETGETCWYTFGTPAIKSLGKGILSVKDVTINGNDLWRIEYYVVIPGEGASTFNRVDVFKKDFKPFTGSSKGASGNFKVKFEKDHIQLDTDSPGTKDTKEIPINNVVYDNNQFFYLFRRLPLNESYSASFSIFLPQTEKIMKVELRTTSIETVKVPAGTFECYCVELVMDSNIKVKQWISTDDKRYLVKYDAGAKGDMELEKIEQVSKDEPEVLNDSEFGISMSAPAGWHMVKSPIKSDPYKMIVVVVPPESNAWFPFLIIPHGMINPDSNSLRGLVDSGVGVCKQVMKNYSVDFESWKADFISGLHSISYRADFDGKDKKMVEYRTYIVDKSFLYLFVIRTEKEFFENSEKEFLSVIQSFNVRDK
jgi:hypothetical protein